MQTSKKSIFRSRWSSILNPARCDKASVISSSNLRAMMASRAATPKIDKIGPTNGMSPGIALAPPPAATRLE